MSEPKDFFELVGVKKTDDPWVFEAVSLPGRAGNIQPIAFGGCALATALYAAAQTFAATPYFVPYSIVGHFLGPGHVSSPYICEVAPMRDTRTFITRHVTVKQKTPKGVRSVLALTLDMVRSPNATKEGRERARALGKEPGAVSSLLHYQPKPKIAATHHRDLAITSDEIKRRVKIGEIPEAAATMYDEFLGLWNDYFEGKACPEGMMNQNMMGLNLVPTTQDDLPVTERCNLDWLHIREQLPPDDGTNQMSKPRVPGLLPVSAVMAHTIAFAFAMDGVLGFLPVPLANRNMMDASAFATLDFAQRFHTDVFDANKWFLRDARTVAAGWQRTFSEAYFYDEDGHMISSCSQQCVLRPAEDEDAPSAKL
ncbi:hypothetical protein MSPP1_003819 [Malassezia sp. CBS 17886]|nr:hypothetical protein MSPP1_003819 [Malassezia sp. CBS 17886]